MIGRYYPIGIEIEALRFTQDAAAALRAFAGGKVLFGATAGDPIQVLTRGGGVAIALPGDWIIRGADGEFDRCDPERFARTYRAVSSNPVAAAT